MNCDVIVFVEVQLFCIYISAVLPMLKHGVLGSPTALLNSPILSSSAVHGFQLSATFPFVLVLFVKHNMFGSNIPYRIFPYLGSAHQVFILHIVRFCASSLCAPFSFKSSDNMTPPQF